MPLSDTLRTKVHIASVEGEVRPHPWGYELRTAAAPTYFHGTCLVLEETPESFPWLLNLHREVFGDDVSHRLVVWSGKPITEPLLKEARAGGFEPDGSLAMAIREAPAADERWEVRPLETGEWDDMDALNALTDGAESADGDPAYALFKLEKRALRRRSLKEGRAVWWGVFKDAELVGQCGLTLCDSEVGSGLARLRDVEVAPDWRRRGVGSSLVRTVTRDAFLRLKALRVLLEADPLGPAVALYRRIGFEFDQPEQGLLWSRSELTVRDEVSADWADVRTLTTAAFGGPDEAKLVEQLRDLPDVVSLVAERDGSILGHVMLSQLEVSGVRAVALAPLAVRPPAQRSGIGTALVHAIIERARAAKAGAVVVLGSPAYYGRFGFVPASSLEWTSQWPDAGDAFQLLALRDDLPRSVAVRYGEPFV